MRRLCGVIMLFLALVLPARAADGPLTFGVFPYISRGQLMEQHDPLRQYLQQKLGRPIDFVTAPDFPEFLARTSRGEYDIVFTAPHLARFAEVNDGYRRLVRTGHNVQGIFLVRRDSAVHSLADLKGKTVMMAQPLSIVYQMANEQLRRQGLVGGQNIAIVDTRTHNNALGAPMRNEADVSVTGALLWQGADAETRASMRQIDTTEKMPGFILMAHQRLPAPQFNKLKAALMNFRRTPEGKEFFKATGFEAFLSIDNRTMKRMDAYTKILPVQSR